MTSLISEEELREHFKIFTSESRNKQQEKEILSNCIKIFEKDGPVIVIPNNGLCETYPKKLIIPINQSGKQTDPEKLKNLFDGSRYARLRDRFPIPIINFNGKNICRSSTLAQKAECVVKAAKNGFTLQGAISWISGDKTNSAENILDNSRTEDIALIKELRIRYICDLMVEDKKKKYGIYVSSSEKTDRLARYAEFCLTAIPFPGTEFFTLWKEHNYELMEVDWELFGTNTTSIVLDPDGPRPFATEKWKSWNIIELTKNYLSLILTYLATPGDEGILIHCISGWDRTPLYISLVRLSLWADGAIHQTLNALEILYLTLNYDWFLFHHYLHDRCSRGEDIFYFCFVFLAYIIGDEFSIDNIFKNVENQIHSSSCKISIRPSDEETDDSQVGSFGSVGRSWEMTSGYMDQYIKPTGCLFLDDSSFPLSSESTFSDKAEKVKESEASDDALFSFDDGEEEEEFHVINMHSSCDGLRESATNTSGEPTRASRLLEVRRMMMELYNSFLGNTL